MAKEIIEYLTREEAETAIQIRNADGWRALHTDYITDAKNPNKFSVTFVTLLDDPANSAKNQTRKTEFMTVNTIKEKMSQGTATSQEKDELLKKLAEKL